MLMLACCLIICVRMFSLYELWRKLSRQCTFFRNTFFTHCGGSCLKDMMYNRYKLMVVMLNESAVEYYGTM